MLPQGRFLRECLVAHGANMWFLGKMDTPVRGEIRLGGKPFAAAITRERAKFRGYPLVLLRSSCSLVSLRGTSGTSSRFILLGRLQNFGLKTIVKFAFCISVHRRTRHGQRAVAASRISAMQRRGEHQIHLLRLVAERHASRHGIHVRGSKAQAAMMADQPEGPSIPATKDRLRCGVLGVVCTEAETRSEHRCSFPLLLSTSIYLSVSIRACCKFDLLFHSIGCSVDVL